MSVVTPQGSFAGLPPPPRPAAAAPSLLRTLAFLSAAVALIIAFTCGAVLVVGSMVSFGEPTVPEPADALAFAGFGDITGLEISSLEELSWLDHNMEFTLRWSPADIDRALEAAHFMSAFEPGVPVQKPSGF